MGAALSRTPGLAAAPAGWAELGLATRERPLASLSNDQPYLLLDDARFGDSCICFSQPRRIIVAETLGEVATALEQIREGVESGLYAAGYLAYEAGLAFEPRLGRLEMDPGSLPLLWFGLFDAPAKLNFPAKAADQGSTDTAISLQSNEAAYREAIEAILKLIQDGDCYQVNFTVDGILCSEMSPFEQLHKLRRAQRAGWGGMLSMGGRGLVSCSPELFFASDGNEIWTKPMKGTARRGGSDAEDQLLKQSLRASTKDRAENLMIVDLLRNDLSRIAVPGSVKVEELFEIETYPTVHQMTSCISARLRSGVHAVDVIRSLFPCGSITGAPKIRAMEIIAAAEQRTRGPYTGSMGFIAPDGSAAFNVLIRTLEYADFNEPPHFGVGSGIVADSNPGLEWLECLTKTRFLSY